MKFIVHPYRGDEPRRPTPPFVRLVRDNWDDYGYKTTFGAELHLAADDMVKLGSVKILKQDQTDGYTPLPKEPFERLGLTYCSLGQDLEYYEQLFKRGPSVYEAYLRRLSDVVFDDEVRARFEDSEGYKVSLLRFSGAMQALKDAPKLFRQQTRKRRRRGEGFQIKFKTRLADEASPVTVAFDFRRQGALPNRINAIIGYNGTGKTQLLSNLATVASGYGYHSKEDAFAERAGRFVGAPPPVQRVVVVSYSAFDTFEIPGRDAMEQERVDAEGGLFGYVYCGLRERIREKSDAWSYRLKTPTEVRDEFLSALGRIREAERTDEFLEVLRPLLQDASFQRVGLTKLYADSKSSVHKELFDVLSAGHKVVLKIVSQLTAHVDDKRPTLVIIDEPEAHLHPPLLAALLHSIRTCLDRFDAYAVVATHSPVVLQETPSRFVQILRRFGNRSVVEAPSIETFGENIGVLTQEVFNLDDGSTDWHATLRELAGTLSLTEIEDLFGRRLGFGPRSYVLSLQDDDGGGE